MVSSAYSNTTADSIRSIYSQCPFVMIIDMQSMHASQISCHLGVILTFTMFITHALILTHLLGTLDTTVYSKHLYYLLRQPHKHLPQFSLTFFTVNGHPLLGARVFMLFLWEQLVPHECSSFVHHERVSLVHVNEHSPFYNYE